jgi:hypothetical protein
MFVKCKNWRDRCSLCIGSQTARRIANNAARRHTLACFYARTITQSKRPKRRIAGQCRSSRLVILASASGCLSDKPAAADFITANKDSGAPSTLQPRQQPAERNFAKRLERRPRTRSARLAPAVPVTQSPAPSRPRPARRRRPRFQLRRVEPEFFRQRAVQLLSAAASARRRAQRAHRSGRARRHRNWKAEEGMAMP